MSLSSSSSSSLSTTAGRGAGPCPEPVSIDRLQGSSLKDSAIARLLLKGRLTDKAAAAAAATVRAAPSAAATAADTARVLTPPPPMDLSTTNRTTKHIGINNTSFSLTTITTMERLRYILGCEIQSLLYRLSGSAPSSPLTVVDSQDDPGGGLLHHACRLCPYVASMAVELLVHYRSHNDNLAHLGQKSPDVLSAWFGYYLKASTLGGSMSTPGEPRGQPGSPRPLNCPVQSSSSSSRLDLRELLLKPMKATSMTSDDLSLTPCRLRPPSTSSILLLKSMGSKMAAAAADELSRSRSSTPYTTISIATDEDNNNHHHYHHHHQQALYQHNDDHHHQQQHPHAKRTTNGRQRTMTYYCRDDDDVTSASRVVKCEFADDVTRSPPPVRSPPMSSCSEKEEEEEEEDQEDEDEEEEKSGNDSRCCCSSSLEGVGSGYDGRFCNGRGAGADRSPPTLKREIVKKEEEEEEEERKGPPRDGGGGGGLGGSAFGGGFDCGGGRVTANRLLRGESPRRNGTATSSSPTSPEISSNFHRRNPRTGSGSHPPGAGDGVQQQPRSSSSSNENHCDVTDSSIAVAVAAAAAAAAAGRQCQSPPDNSGGEPAELRYAYKQYKRLRKSSAPRSFRPASSSSLPVLGRGDGGGGGGGGGAGSSVPRGHDPEEATPGGHRQNDELIAKEEEEGGGGGGGRPEDSRNNYIDVAVQCDLIIVDTQPPSCRTGHQQWEGEEMEEEEEGEEDEQEEEDGVAVRVPCQASRCCRPPRKRTFPADETTTTDVTASDANFLLHRRSRRSRSRSRLRRRCSPCGITFDDDVIFSIHMGCHSHAHPFVCNVCGRQCENKYGFNTHVLRGHHPT